MNTDITDDIFESRIRTGIPMVRSAACRTWSAIRCGCEFDALVDAGACVLVRVATQAANDNEFMERLLRDFTGRFATRRERRGQGTKELTVTPAVCQGSPKLGRPEVALVAQVAQAMARRLWHRPNACDLESLGLVVLCEAAEHYDPSRTAFAPYLVERLRWAMVSDARRAARRERLLDEATPSQPARRPRGGSQDEGSESQEPDAEPLVDPETAAEKQLLRARLHDALAKLPGEARSVLIGHYFGGQSLEAVARELGRSKATMTRIHQAGLRELALSLGMPLE